MRETISQWHDYFKVIVATALTRAGSQLDSFRANDSQNSGTALAVRRWLLLDQAREKQAQGPGRALVAQECCFMIRMQNSTL